MQKSADASILVLHYADKISSRQLQRDNISLKSHLSESVLGSHRHLETDPNSPISTNTRVCCVPITKKFVGSRRELPAGLNNGIADVQKKIPHAEEIRWDFNPPPAPHFGCPWERMIHTAKRTLLINLGSQNLTLDFYTTILAETALMLNSRPLTHANDQTENEEPLTPNHFLLHCPFANIPPIVFEETDKPLFFNS